MASTLLIASVTDIVAALPSGPVEPADLSFVPGVGRGLGSVFEASKAVAADFSWKPAASRAGPGCCLIFSLTPREFGRLSFAHHVAKIHSAAAHLRIDVGIIPPPSISLWSFASPDSVPALPRTAIDVIPNISMLRIDVRVWLAQDTTPAWARLCVRSITLHGEAVLGPPLPWGIPVRIGAPRPPLVLAVGRSYASTTPCFSADGTLFVPSPLNCGLSGGGGIIVFSADGRALPSIPATLLGTSPYVVSAAIDGGDDGTLFVVAGEGRIDADSSAGDAIDAEAIPPMLVAVDLATGRRFWAATAIDDSSGIAITRMQVDRRAAERCVLTGGIASGRHTVISLRVGDGRCISERAVSGAPLGFAASDQTVFYNSAPGVRQLPQQLSHLVPGAAVTDGPVLSSVTVSAPSGRRALTLVPERLGSPAHLVWADHGSATLHIWEVLAGGGPENNASPRLHELRGVAVTGLAADPSGTALAVCDAVSGAVIVMPWPLPLAC